MTHPNYERARGAGPGPRKPSRSFLAVLSALRTAGRDGLYVGETVRYAGIERSVSSRVLARMADMGIAGERVILGDWRDGRHRHMYWLTSLGGAVASELLDEESEPGGSK